MTGTNGARLQLRFDCWPQEQIDTLTRLWTEGYSAGVIGVMMGKSRCAVIGKKHRLKLPGRKPAAELPRRAGYKITAVASRKRDDRKQQANFNFSIGRVMKGPPRPPVPVKLTEIVPLNGDGITILDLDKEKCHAIVKDGNFMVRDALPRYCGHPVAEGQSYCADHYHAFHQPPRPR